MEAMDVDEKVSIVGGKGKKKKTTMQKSCNRHSAGYRHDNDGP